MSRNDQKLYRLAQRKAKAKKWFYRHLALYGVFSTFLLLMNLLDGGSLIELWSLWALYPILSWGTVVAVHYLWLFGIPFLDKAGTREWEAAQVEREFAKLQAATGAPLPLQAPVSAAKKVAVNSQQLDEHLELREVPKKQKALLSDGYKQEDLV